MRDFEKPQVLEQALDDRIRDLASLQLYRIQDPEIPSSTRQELILAYEEKRQKAAELGGIAVDEIERRIRLAKQSLVFGLSVKPTAPAGQLRREVLQLDPYYKLGWTLNEAKAPIRSMALHPQGKYVAAGTDDAKIWIWELAPNGAPKGTPTPRQLGKDTSLSGRVRSVAFSPDGTTLVAGNNRGEIWILGVPKERPGENEPRQVGKSKVRAITFTPDGKHVVVSLERGVRVMHVGGQKPIQHLGDGAALSAAVSPDGELLIGVVEFLPIQVWIRGRTGKFTDPRPLGPKSTHGGALAFNSDGKYLVIGDWNWAHLWEIGENHKITYKRTLEAPPDEFNSLYEIRSLAFNGDGRFLLGASHDHSIYLWRTKDERILQRLPGHSASVHTVAFGPEDRFVVSAAEDRTVRIWRDARGE